MSGYGARTQRHLGHIPRIPDGYRASTLNVESVKYRNICMDTYYPVKFAFARATWCLISRRKSRHLVPIPM